MQIKLNVLDSRANWKCAVIFALMLVLVIFWHFMSSRRVLAAGLKSIVLYGGENKFEYNYEVLGLLNHNNMARLSAAVDPVTRDLLQKDDDRLFHLVTTFVPFDHPDVRKGLLINDDLPPTDQEVEARMAEVTNCLQRNLDHSLIAYVHVLVLREETITFLQMLDIKNSHKLIIHKNGESPTLKQEVLYAAKYLKGKTVIVSHQDNYIGEGWEKVNLKMLQKKKLMYALTRHPSPLKCSATTTAAHCGEDYPYLGSHDTFVFHVQTKFPGHQLVEVDVTPNMAGIENVLIWIFKTRFNYKVLNPCKVLIVYHSHCISIREMGRERINVEGKNALVYFTYQLE